jgi:hypothetical protein
MTSRLHRNFGLLLASNVLWPIISIGLGLAISGVRGAPQTPGPNGKEEPSVMRGELRS